MSAFGSSSINKSGKIITPKAPPRRRSLNSSARAASEANPTTNVATQATSRVFKDATPKAQPGPREARSDVEEQREFRRKTWSRRQITSKSLMDSSCIEESNRQEGTTPTSHQQESMTSSGFTTQTVSTLPQSPEDYETPSEQLRRENEHQALELPTNKSRDVFVITTPFEIDGAPMSGVRLKRIKTRTARTLDVDNESSNAVLNTFDSGPSHIATRTRKPTQLSSGKSASPSDKPSQAVGEDEVESILTEADSTQPRKRRRLHTPDGYEDVTIVPSMVTMFELSSRRSRIGKLSEREKKMRQIDWEAVHTRRKEEESKMAFSKGTRVTLPKDDRENDSEEENDEEDIDARIAKAARGNRETRQGIQIRVVNGEHLVDPESQKVDRHALANQDMETLEEFEEDDLTKKFNSHTYIHMKRRDPVERIPSKDKWTFEETDKFYQYLSQFGTDFMIISRMFPGRSRRHIKAKFIREERSDPDRVRRALVGEERKAWNLDAYRRATGLGEEDFRDPRKVEEELQKRREEREEEIERQKRKTEELQRQKRLAGHVDENDEYDEENANGTSALDEEILEVIDE